MRSRSNLENRLYLPTSFCICVGHVIAALHKHLQPSPVGAFNLCRYTICPIPFFFNTIHSFFHSLVYTIPKGSQTWKSEIGFAFSSCRRDGCFTAARVRFEGRASRRGRGDESFDLLEAWEGMCALPTYILFQGGFLKGDLNRWYSGLHQSFFLLFSFHPFYFSHQACWIQNGVST